MKPIAKGKVRDIYAVADDKLAIVTSDRISAFDTILPKPVEDKGKVLNALSLFWFNFTKSIVNNHVITSDIKFIPEAFKKPEFEGRTVLVKKLEILPFEFVVRGYVFGSMWKAYSETGEFCGEKIRTGYSLAEKLDKPILTVSTKADEGSDEYVSFWRVTEKIEVPLFTKIKEICFALYEACADYALHKGIIIADTKFEFGLDENGILCLADEICTPDSSRMWSVDDYRPGASPKSYDKQFLRDWLLENEMKFDEVPDEIYNKISQIYGECMKKIIG